MSRPTPIHALAAYRAPTPAAAIPRVASGAPGLDARLAGGLAQAALHEFYPATEGAEAATAGFALLLAQRCPRSGPIFWLRDGAATRGSGRLYGLGLAELGLDPARLLLVHAPDTLALLRAAAEAVTCPAVATIILEPHGKATAFDLTATRRLALAAARSGVFALLLRSGEPPPSAAHSRWQVAAAPSQALAANAPGGPAFDLTLLRHRGGVPGFNTRLEWNRDRSVFEAPLPRAAPAAAPERAVAADRRRAA